MIEVDTSLFQGERGDLEAGGKTWVMMYIISLYHRNEMVCNVCNSLMFHNVKHIYVNGRPGIRCFSACKTRSK